MAGLDPEVSFVPTVKNAFPHDDLVFVKVAINGQPISMWLKEWDALSGSPEKSKRAGHLYERILEETKKKLEGKPTPTSVAFIWMQGEANAKGNGKVYESCLEQLWKNLKRDFNREQLPFVLGKISDYNETSTDPAKAKPDWELIRLAQERFVLAHPNQVACVNTDDLNGMENSLHYNKEGYKTLGTRFATKAIELITGSPVPVVTNPAPTSPEPPIQKEKKEKKNNKPSKTSTPENKSQDPSTPESKPQESSSTTP